MGDAILERNLGAEGEWQRLVGTGICGCRGKITVVSDV